MNSSLIIPLMLAAMAVFMFLSIRNQKKRAAAMTQMQDSVEPGARVQLHSGLFGTIVDASGDEIVKLEIAPGVVTEWNRLAIREIIPPAGAADDFDGATPAVPDSPAGLDDLGLNKETGLGKDVDLDKGDRAADDKRDEK